MRLYIFFCWLNHTAGQDRSIFWVAQTKEGALQVMEMITMVVEGGCALGATFGGVNLYWCFCLKLNSRTEHK